MAKLDVVQPMLGCRAVVCDGRVVLIGQPPEVLKSLLKLRAGTLDAVILPRVRERGGVLLNNIEFLLYYFLFFDKGLENGRRLKLVGDAVQVSQMFELLRLALLGPSEEEYQLWGTPPALRDEWLNASRFFALKDEQGRVRHAPSFFEVIPFVDGRAALGYCDVERLEGDRYRISAGNKSVEADLEDCTHVDPPYPVGKDYVPSGLVKFGLEVLGGASGFSTEQASTGLVLCTNGHYLLIDAIPFLEQHVQARGISKNQIAGVFLTHLHDDHCNMFPLMLAAHRVDVITTREIFSMAMTKLAMGLGWRVEAVREHFNFVEVRLGEPLRYYGLEIVAHHTVHSIPTIGGVFRATDHGHQHEVCLVGDIQTFSEIADMRRQGLVRAETERYLNHLYRKRFDLLIADGGMGPIHGDPTDALGSKAERVVFVHVDSLPERFNATFSLANSGKRYMIVEGDGSICTTRAIGFLMDNFGAPLTSRWLSTLFADMVIKRYNTDDVIIKQNAETWNHVYLILTGFCDVIHHDGEQFATLGTREAGDLMGEMAVVTGRNVRNASVVARTPVLACQFSEETFNSFIEESGLKATLLARWARRSAVASLPQFQGLTTTVVDALCAAGQEVRVGAGDDALNAGGRYWCIVTEGTAVELGGGDELVPGDEIGTYRPHAPGGPAGAESQAGCTVLRFSAGVMKRLVAETPQLNYSLRRYRGRCERAPLPWVIAHDNVN